MSNKNSWATDIEINKDNVENITDCIRARRRPPVGFHARSAPAYRKRALSCAEEHRQAQRRLRLAGSDFRFEIGIAVAPASPPAQRAALD
jgi:hypothetical protein